MPVSPEAYSPTEVSEILLDFYQFLTTLHYDAQYLKTPPPEGWPGLNPLLDYLARSNHVCEVMKRIPYFDNDCKSYIHFKSRFIDFPTLPERYFKSVMDWRVQWSNEAWSNRRDTIVDFYDFFPLALGHETWSRHIWFNARDGEIIEEAHREGDPEPVDLKEYLEALKQAYISLDLIPCRGRLTIEVIDVNELPEGQRVTEGEVIAQDDEWGTDLDIQFIRQLYRDCGWPNVFRREEAFDAVDILMDKIKDRRGEWEVEREDWITGHWC